MKEDRIERWSSVAVVERVYGRVCVLGVCLYQLCTNKANDCHLASEQISEFLFFYVTKLPGQYSSPARVPLFKTRLTFKLKTQLE